MRAFFIIVFLVITSTLFGNSSLWNFPKWYAIEVEDITIIYDEQFEFRAQLTASFLKNILEQDQNYKKYIRRKYFVIDSHFISNNITFDLTSFINTFFAEKSRQKNMYQSIYSQDFNQISLSAMIEESSSIKKELLQFAYSITKGGTLKNTKKLIYPKWFDKSNNFLESSLLVSYKREMLLESYSRYRDLLISDIDISYNQTLNGSFKRNIPPSYFFGNLSKNYFLYKFGNEKWGDIIEDVEFFDSIFYPYSNAFKKNTGITLNEFYDDTKSFYKHLFTADINLLPPDASLPILSNYEVYNHPKYTFPTRFSDGTLICKYSSLDEADQIVRIKPNQEIEHLSDIGFSSSKTITANEPYVLWTEKYSTPSFFDFDYSRIIIFNTKTKKKRTISRELMYQEPVLSLDQNAILTVSVDNDLNQNLKIIDFKTGETLRTIPNINCWGFSDLVWISSSKIGFIATDFMDLKAIVIFDLVSEQFENLSPFSAEPISGLYAKDEQLFFSYPVNDIYNICTISLTDTLAYQTFYSEYGAFQPSVQDSTLLFSSSRFWGSEIRHISLTKEFWSPILWESATKYTQNCRSIISGLNSSSLPSSKINPLYKLINFSKFGLNYDQKEAFLYAISRNPMRTFTLNSKMSYNFYNSNVKTSVSALLSKYYPNFLGELSHENESDDSVNYDTFIYKGSFKFPYNLSSGTQKGYYDFNIGLAHVDRYTNQDLTDIFKNSDFKLNYFYSKFYLVMNKKKAMKHIYSPFGQTYSLKIYKSLTEIKASQFSANINFSLPGVKHSHSTLIETSFQYEDNQNEYKFANNFSSPYGYYEFPAYNRIYSTRFKYLFPLLYPERGISNTIYFKRFYGSLFVNYSKSVFNLKPQNRVKEMNSIGGELFLDYTVLNKIALKVGIRYSYLLNSSIGKNGSHQVDITIPVKKF